ncbi:Late competence development protein ComFB [Caldicellulosiruptor obsidiansis OB47]|uniref:Late competence development protein ComFB n=1 Tax=Caldicellulosiruptor obsidiansis (strain ATCC BAA-2073 / JCM 16842 / OB47) TaxID=608506 RepID=D9TFJ5_CALOO|nr:late competence development ComFB family protein [Caldicellulosiruptor obsidiansis]ADL42965.1 Late competence development protein ComFB [Caldicellulosiruptor obsidiansis OB47]
MYVVKNLMEEVVQKYYEKIIDELDVCRCEKCKADVMALALNRLPPRYCVTEEGKMYVKLKELEIQFEVDIIAALAAAAYIVKNNIRHEERDCKNEM